MFVDMARPGDRPVGYFMFVDRVRPGDRPVGCRGDTLCLLIGYGLEIDLWAVGVILYILLCGFPPFRSRDRHQSELFELIQAGKFAFHSPYWDPISEGMSLLFTVRIGIRSQKVGLCFSQSVLRSDLRR